MKALMLLATALWMMPMVGSAQEPIPGDPNYPMAKYEAEGRLLVLKVVPGNKSAKLFFVGKKAAELDLKAGHKLLSVTAMGEGQKEELKFRNTGDSYEVTNFPEWPKAFELRVKSEIKGQIEEHKLKIQPSKP